MTSGVELAFSPPVNTINNNSNNIKSSTSCDVTFRSPRPVKASNIRVVTRIRPLLHDEISRGRQASIIPIPDSTISPKSSTEDDDDDDERSTVSPRTSMLSRFRPSRNNSPNLQTDSILPLNPHSSTPSSLPPPKASSLKTPASRQSSASTAMPILSTSTSLYAITSPSSKKQFDFDAVLGMESTQQQVYATAVGDKILNNIFRGINCTIMAYGQTASGKSHTMQGYNDDDNALTTRHSWDDAENQCPNSPSSVFHISENDGIIPRAIHDLFKGKLEYSKGTVAIDLSYFELYNDDIKDLLADDDDEYHPLKMLDQGEHGVMIEGLTTIPIHSAKQVYNLIKYCAQRRATASTNANVQSSRSHAICTLTVSITPTNKTGGSEYTQAKLTLVDLAGSERLKRSGVVGQQQQESITINKDLFVLGKVVAALADKSRSSSGKGKHVPFRDSKLTRLLRESLGGNCFTVLISCVSPADIDMEESINTLRYAERARSISNSIKRNVALALLTPDECTALTAENVRLKALVTKLKNRVAADAGSLLDHEEAESRCSSPRSEIFRMSSKSSSEEDTNHSVQESRSDKPIWMHFKSLAAITKNVTIPKDSQREPSREIELKDRASGSQAQWRDSSLPIDPESCLSYEMSLLQTKTDDLADCDEAKAHSISAVVHVERERNSLREEVDKLNLERDEITRAIESKKQELISLSGQVDEKSSSLEIIVAKHGEELASVSSFLDGKKADLENTKSSLEQLHEQMRVDRSKHEELLEFIEKVTENANFLNLSSPQRSFSGIAHSLQSCTGPDEATEYPEDKSEELKDLLRVARRPGSLRGQSLTVVDELLDTQDNNVAKHALENELENAKKQQLLSERNKLISNSHIAYLQGLQGRVSELEIENADLKEKHRREIESLNLTVTEERRKEDKTLANQDASIKALKEVADSERERCRSLEERLNFSYQDYESMASTLQQKISDLQDQVHCLRKTVSDLEGEAKMKNTMLEKEKVEKSDLSNQVKDLEQKVATLKDSLCCAQAREENSQNRNDSDNSEQAQTSKTLALLTQISSPQTTSSCTCSEPKQNESPESAESKNSYIRMKTTKMLKLADDAIENCGLDSCSSSAGGTEFRPMASDHSNTASAAAPAHSTISGNGVKGTGALEITNLALVKKQNVCSCSSTLFASKRDYVEFYLPQISVECTCGKMAPNEYEDPCALESILRPWQVQFLAHVGITDAVSLVHSSNQRGGVLSSELRKWRRSQGLPSVRTKSCGVAIHIWSRTCKSVIRSVRAQRAQGIEAPKRPEFLELNISENNTAVSSLGDGPFLSDVKK